MKQESRKKKSEQAKSPKWVEMSEPKHLKKLRARTSDLLWRQHRSPEKLSVDYKPRLTLENLYQKFFWQLESHAIEEILKEKAKVTQSIDELSKERDVKAGEREKELQDKKALKTKLIQAAEEKEAEVRKNLKRVLYGFTQDPRLVDQSQSIVGQQIIDLFYRLMVAENFRQLADRINNLMDDSDIQNLRTELSGLKGAASEGFVSFKREAGGLFAFIDDAFSKHHMLPLLWYVKSYQDFQVGLFQWNIQTKDFEQLIIDQIESITVPGVNGFINYKGDDGSYDIESLSHDCLYNAITLAVCAREAQMLAKLYTPIPYATKNNEFEVDDYQQKVLNRHVAFFEQQAITALVKAESFYGLYLGIEASLYTPKVNKKDRNPGNDKKVLAEEQFKEMFLNLIANEAPFHGWSSTKEMAHTIAPKLLLFYKRLYKIPRINSEAEMEAEILVMLKSRKVKSYKYEYYVYASSVGREKYKRLETVKAVKERADQVDLERKRMAPLVAFRNLRHRVKISQKRMTHNKASIRFKRSIRTASIWERLDR